MDTVSDFRGWIPIRVYPHANDFWVDWLRLGATPLTDPFFQQSIQDLMRHPFHQGFRRQTPISQLLEWSQNSPGLPPSGFVFHTSRCGSTLISQIFAASESNVVYSEPPALDALLRSLQRFPSWAPATRIESLQALLSAWGQPMADIGSALRKHVIVKQDGWSSLNAPLVKAAWPNTPWVFLYRDPVEILVSQMRQRAAFLIPGVVDWLSHEVMTPEDAEFEPVAYCAQKLGAMLEAMVRYFDPATTLLVNYSELPASVMTRVAPHFGVQIDSAQVADLDAVLARNAKNPGQAFSSDSANKQREADAHTRAMATRWMQPHYEQLEALRQQQIHGSPATQLAQTA
ncbi:MAG: sulfotransferase [Rhodoferax sp.]